MNWKQLIRRFFVAVILMVQGTLMVTAQTDTGVEIIARAITTGGTAGYKIGLFPHLVIGGILQGALLILGSIFLALMVYGGYLWMLARGSSEKVEKAKEIIIAATIGMIIVLSAYAVTFFILSRIGQATGYETGV